MELVNFIPAGSNLYLIASCTTTFLLHDSVDILHNFNSASLNNLIVELIFDMSQQHNITEEKSVNLVFYHVNGKELLRFNDVKIHAGEIFETRVEYCNNYYNPQGPPDNTPALYNGMSHIKIIDDPKLSCIYKMDAASINKVNGISSKIRKKIYDSIMFKILIEENGADNVDNADHPNSFSRSIINNLGINLYIAEGLTKDTRKCIIM